MEGIASKAKPGTDGLLKLSICDCLTYKQTFFWNARLIFSDISYSNRRSFGGLFICDIVFHWWRKRPIICFAILFGAAWFRLHSSLNQAWFRLESGLNSTSSYISQWKEIVIYFPNMSNSLLPFFLHSHEIMSKQEI